MASDRFLAGLAVPDDEDVLAAIGLAARAPSVHNTQPWQWVFDGGRLHLYADPDRLLPATDPLGRQLVISCGAMLHHARTVFAARGWHTDITRLPDPNDPTHLATLEFRPWPDPPEGVLRRAGVVERRRTDRLPLGEPRGHGQLARAARMLATPHHVEVDALDETTRRRLVEVSAHAVAARRGDALYEAELTWWTGSSGESEGIPETALASEAESACVDFGREFPRASSSAGRAGATDNAGLMVLSSPGDSRVHWLRTGEALSAVLLECTAAGLATCTVTHVTEQAENRQAIAELLARPGLPQVVVRVGVAPEEPRPARTPRRPLSEILAMASR